MHLDESTSWSHGTRAATRCLPAAGQRWVNKHSDIERRSRRECSGSGEVETEMRRLGSILPRAFGV